MGWATKAAKLGIRAIRNAPNKSALWDEISAAKSMIGKVGKSVPRSTYRDMLNRGNEAETGSYIRNTLRYARNLKKEFPKVYAKAKKAVEMKRMEYRSGNYGKALSTLRSKARTETSRDWAKEALKNLEKATRKREGTMIDPEHINRHAERVLNRLNSLAKRNLLPVGAAVAGAAASRNSKNGYAMGGQVVGKQIVRNRRKEETYPGNTSGPPVSKAMMASAYRKYGAKSPYAWGADGSIIRRSGYAMGGRVPKRGMKKGC